MSRRAMDPAVYGPRWLAGERLADLAREVGWQIESLRAVLHRHGYMMTPEQVSARQAAAAARVAAERWGSGALRVPTAEAHRSIYREHAAAAPAITRTCSLCLQPFQTDSRFIRTCEPCKAEVAA